MGIYTRKESRYYWMWIEGKGIRKSTGILVTATTAQQTKENRRLAELAYHEAMTNAAKLRLDLPEATADRTLAKHCAWYARHVAAHHRGAAREASILAHLARLIGTYDLRRIDPATAQEYITARTSEGIGPSTINREITVLKLVLSSAIPRYLRINPLAGFKRLRHRVERKRMIRAEEEAALLAALRPETRDLYILAVDTLLRQSNAVHLHRREVKGDYLALEDSKTGPYTVPLSDRAAAIVRTRLKTGHLFPDWHQRFTASQAQASVELNRELKAAARAAGIETDGSDGRLSWHTATRATGATRMIAAGINPRTVQMIGNWRSFDQMAAYLELDTGGGHAAVNAIAALTSHSQDEPKSW